MYSFASNNKSIADSSHLDISGWISGNCEKATLLCQLCQQVIAKAINAANAWIQPAGAPFTYMV